jgi:hypothetical protein
MGKPRPRAQRHLVWSQDESAPPPVPFCQPATRATTLQVCCVDSGAVRLGSGWTVTCLVSPAPTFSNLCFRGCGLLTLTTSSQGAVLQAPTRVTWLSQHWSSLVQEPGTWEQERWPRVDLGRERTLKFTSALSSCSVSQRHSKLGPVSRGQKLINVYLRSF